jgi:hypothetical protein
MFPAGLAELLEQTEQHVLSHMDMEESTLFPLLIAGDGSKVQPLMATLRAAHNDQSAMLSKILALTPQRNAARRGLQYMARPLQRPRPSFMTTSAATSIWKATCFSASLRSLYPHQLDQPVAEPVAETLGGSCIAWS